MSASRWIPGHKQAALYVWSRRIVSVVLLTVSVLGCGCSSRRAAYASARDLLDADVQALPLRPGSEIIARYDGLSRGKAEVSSAVFTEMVVGNSVPATDVFRLYRDQLLPQGCEVPSYIAETEPPSGVVLTRGGRYKIDVSEYFHPHTIGIPRDTVENAEADFVSLVYIYIDYGVYDRNSCQKAIDRLDDWGE